MKQEPILMNKTHAPKKSGKGSKVTVGEISFNQKLHIHTLTDIPKLTRNERSVATLQIKPKWTTNTETVKPKNEDTQLNTTNPST